MGMDGNLFCLCSAHRIVVKVERTWPDEDPKTNPQPYAISLMMEQPSHPRLDVAFCCVKHIDEHIAALQKARALWVNEMTEAGADINPTLIKGDGRIADLPAEELEGA